MTTTPEKTVCDGDCKECGVCRVSLGDIQKLIDFQNSNWTTYAFDTHTGRNLAFDALGGYKVCMRGEAKPIYIGTMADRALFSYLTGVEAAPDYDVIGGE